MADLIESSTGSWSSDLTKLSVPFPTDANRTSKFDSEIVSQDAHATEIIVHRGFQQLVQSFLDFKREKGSAVEKAVYKTADSFTWMDEVSRLISKRPLMFMGSSDDTILRDGTELQSGREEWDRVGTQVEHVNRHLTLQDYLSYDEIMLSSLVGVSGPSFFINDGNRFNCAKPGKASTFQHRGIIIGLVGPRFERANRMDSVYILPPSGSQRQDPAMRQHFETFFGVTQDLTRSFDSQMYKARIRITAEMLLLEANHRAARAGSKACVYVVGLGLGVWQRHSEQEKWYIQTFTEMLVALDLPEVTTIEFAWITVSESLQQQAVDAGKAKNIRILFSQRSPAAKLDTQELLVLSYAWDGNAFPGNEFWARMLASSGDPAAACMSTIGELHNPILNPGFTKRIRVTT